MLIHVYIYIYIYMYISVLFIYSLQIFGYDSLWYNCSIVIIIYILFFLFFIFFYFPCISLFYSFVCSSHLCILSYMYIPYGAFFTNNDFEFEFVLILIIFHLIIIIRCKQCNIIILAGNRR